MSSRYVLAPKADRDIDEIGEYLAVEAGLDLALAFIEEAHQTLALLASRPGVGWPCKVPHSLLEEVRTFWVSARFKSHLIFYRPTETGIHVLRLLHGSRDASGLFDRDDPDS